MPNDDEQLRGLYLPEPHAGLVEEGLKTAILRPTFEPGHRYRDLRGEWLLMTRRDKCGVILGAVAIGEPIKLAAPQVEAREAEHRVARKDRARWWSDDSHLWLYPVKWFVGLPEPRRCVVAPGTQMVVEDVEVAAKDRLVERLHALPAEIVVAKNAASLVGEAVKARSLINGGARVNAIGVFGVDTLVARAVSGVEGIGDAPVANGAWSGEHIPLYDLVLRRKRILEYQHGGEGTGGGSGRDASKTEGGGAAGAEAPVTMTQTRNDDDVPGQGQDRGGGDALAPLEIVVIEEIESDGDGSVKAYLCGVEVGADAEG